MRDLVSQFADNFMLELDRHVHGGDEQRSVNNPVVFLFVGDSTVEALEAIDEHIRQKWSNSRGIFCIHAYTTRTTHRENVYSFRLPHGSDDKRTVRRELCEQFTRDEQSLFELNRMLRQVSSRIGEQGEQFASFQRLNLAVVTRIDDVGNVLIPELTLLAKSIFQESFKHVQADVYALLKEKNSGEQFGYSTSVGISFLLELDRWQSPDYRYSSALQVTEDRIKLAVEHGPAPLFSIAYLLSDKNERGVFTANSMEENYELICNLNLLKNRGGATAQEKNEAYNEAQFIRNLSHAPKNAYASAGFTKVTRPSRSIALTVLACVYRHFLQTLNAFVPMDKRDVLELLGLDTASLQQQVESLLPVCDKLAEMNGLMSDRMSYSDLRDMTLKQAEEMLYHDGSQRFFESNFVHAAHSMLDAANSTSPLADRLLRNVIENERFGLFQAYVWTAESERGVMGELHKLGKDTARQLESAKEELSLLYMERVDEQPFKKGGFFTSDKERLKNFTRYLFETVYGKKYEILALEIQLKLITKSIGELEKLNGRISQKVTELTQLQQSLDEMARESIERSQDSFGRNIREYYETVVHQIVDGLKSKRGERFFYDERLLGSPSRLYESERTEVLDRLIETCRKAILADSRFQLSFEDELLQRANVTGRYEQREILSKDELFKALDQTLEEQAAIHIEVFAYAQKHRYEESYLFADFSSEFVRYAFESDKGTRTYKLGCVHEKRSSGIEKMKLMGGFHIDDLMYVRHGKKYYDSYVANGYQFHGPSEPESGHD